MKGFIITFLTLVPILVSAQEKQTYKYVERDSALYLDVWYPSVARSDSACVVALFGGGFVEGSRDNNLQTDIANKLTERGFVVVSPDYRLGLKDSAMVASHSKLSKIQDLFQWAIDIATEDCAAALTFIVAHAKELGIHPDKIVLTGCSAGAITVLQLDYCRANNLNPAADLPQGWKPAAVVPYSGAIMCNGKPRWNTPPAPTMLMHGTEDKIVAYKRFPSLMSHALYGANTVFDRMKKQGYPAWIVRYEGIGHEVASFLPGSVDLFCGYVNQVLHGRVTTLDATMTDSRLNPTKWTKMNVFDLYKK